MKTIVIYHRADFDGIFCREIAKKFLPDAELIGWDYGDPVPDPTVVSAADNLYMLDISIEELMGHPKLIWIDHHKSAMEKYGRLPGYQIDGVAACRLVWQYFSNARTPTTKQQFIDRKVSEPWAVRLAGEYDIKDKRDPDAELFQHGLRSKELTPDLWVKLLYSQRDTQLEHDAVMELLRGGEAVQYTKTQENADIITSAGFAVEWRGLKFLACNHARFNSQLFTAAIRPDHDALMGFCYNGKQGVWKFSLYGVPGKPDEDLSILAVSMGGGGHKQACGFSLKELPEWLLTK